MYSFQFVLWSIEQAVRQYQFAIAVYIVFAHVMLAIHEGGHAVTGALVGVRSTGIRIGASPLFTITVRGYAITVGWMPSSGHTTFVDEGHFSNTWQVLVTYLAGPLSVVCAGPVFFLLFRHSHFYVAAIFGALFVVAGICDLRKNCPDGKAIRELWRILRAEVFKDAGQIQ
jgi:hypothetical protein